MWWSEQMHMLLALCVASVGKFSRRPQRAQSTVEYALVGALVVIAAAAALTVLGGDIKMVFSHISDTLKTAGSPS
jgi:Flp pilus assembly pilin Flp